MNATCTVTSKFIELEKQPVTETYSIVMSNGILLDSIAQTKHHVDTSEITTQVTSSAMKHESALPTLLEALVYFFSTMRDRKDRCSKNFLYICCQELGEYEMGNLILGLCQLPESGCMTLTTTRSCNGGNTIGIPFKRPLTKRHMKTAALTSENSRPSHQLNVQGGYPQLPIDTHDQLKLLQNKDPLPCGQQLLKK